MAKVGTTIGLWKEHWTALITAAVNGLAQVRSRR